MLARQLVEEKPPINVWSSFDQSSLSAVSEQSDPPIINWLLYQLKSHQLMSDLVLINLDSLWKTPPIIRGSTSHHLSINQPLLDNNCWTTMLISKPFWWISPQSKSISMQIYFSWFLNVTSSCWRPLGDWDSSIIFVFLPFWSPKITA